MNALLSALSLLFPLALSATTAEDALPKAETILAKLEQANGDVALRAKRKNVVVTGKVTMAGYAGAGSFEEVYVGTQRVKYTVSWMEGWGMTQGTTGAFSWSTDPTLGVTIKEGDEQAGVQRMFAISRRDPWSSLYASASTVGKRELDAVTSSATPAAKRPHWELAMVSKSGKKETWFVDCETNRLARVDLALPNPTGGEIAMQFLFGDYKDVGGILYPHLKKQVVGDLVISFTTSSIAHDVELSEERIAPPAEVTEAFKDPKKRAQASPEDPGACTLETLEPQAYVGIRATVAPNEMSKVLATILPEVSKHAAKVRAPMSGPPFTRYYKVTEKELEIEAGIPLRSPIASEDKFVASELPGGKTAVTWHIGGYHELQKSHKRLEEWIKSQGLEPRAAPWEIYWTDPGLEPDPAKWRTQIFWPVK